MLLLNYQLGKQFNFYNQYLLIDLDLSGENNFILNDLSGNPNELELIGDYLLEFDSETREPSKPDNSPVTKLVEDDKKPY